MNQISLNFFFTQSNKLFFSSFYLWALIDCLRAMPSAIYIAWGIQNTNYPTSKYDNPAI